jgi:hypothetical protein
MANETQKAQPTQEELLKAVADVLDEALQTYDQLSKGEGIANAIPMDQMMGAGPGIVGEGQREGHTSATALGVGTVERGKPAEKAEDGPKEKEKDKEDDDDGDDDDKLMHAYKSLVAKMEERGLFQKMSHEKKKEKMHKSETAAPDQELRKSVDERFEVLTKALNSISDTVKKIASTPAPRKGVTGYQPLKKNDGGNQAATTLKKSEVVDRLVELKKSGDARVDSLFINRIETGRLMHGDVERFKALGIVGE